MYSARNFQLIIGLLCLFVPVLVSAETPIVHDAEYYVLTKQNGEAWAKEDKDLNKTLVEFRKKNGGKPPNIFYILIDDIGFGDLGNKTLNMVRGYKTPSINQFARDGMRLGRMYTEPSCTPTRVAFMTGRQPHRMGMGNTAAYRQHKPPFFQSREVQETQRQAKKALETAHLTAKYR